LIVAISGDSSEEVSVVNGLAGGLGNGTLTNNANRASVTFAGLISVGGTYGEHANERGPGLLVFQYAGIDVAAWTEVLSQDWSSLTGRCRDGKPNLRHAFTPGAAPPITPIYAPRLYYAGAGAKDAAAISRPFLGRTVHDLLTNAQAPAAWSILGSDITPAANASGCFYLVAQGPLKALGWWSFGRLSAILSNPGAGRTGSICDLAYDLVGSEGPLPRNLENCDVHSGNNVVASNDPPVEVLYVKL
jgi:hypothetical protein